MKDDNKKFRPSLSVVTMDDLANTAERLNENNWNTQIKIAQPLVGNYFNGRIEIAMAAMRACEVLEHRRMKYKTEFTPKKFAESIALEPKTLYEWIAVARNVVLRLPEGIYTTEQYSAAYRTHRRVTFEDNKETVLKIFNEEKNLGPYAYYLEQLIKRNRTGYRFLKKRLKDLPEQELKHLRVYTRHMTILLDDFLGKPDVIEPAPEKIQTNRTTDAFSYTKNKSYDGDKK